ncbi:hypothetical protein CEP88_08165 [Roseobacter denitrificans]|uniref:Uncharacterized protein n=2 Tax=Roseobacter denitrificans TaxID=2434 RepID=Q161W7_ROSDO|nr:hypothetical protein RD1_3758 [Roseobacter denitrificans OCh 114]AVL52570.1 hypothetical protein CEP88_08165 [Roseobacter denitrificans]
MLQEKKNCAARQTKMGKIMYTQVYSVFSASVLAFGLVLNAGGKTSVANINSDAPERVFLAAALNVDPASFTPLELISLAAGRTHVAQSTGLALHAPLTDAERAQFRATLQQARALKQAHAVQLASNAPAKAPRCLV